MSMVGAPSLLLYNRFLIPGDEAATAQHIAAAPTAFRLLLLSGLGGGLLFAVLGWAMYRAFEEVDRGLALLLLVLVLVSSTLGVGDVALLATPLALTTHAGALT